MIEVLGASGKIAEGARQILGAADRGVRLTRQLLTFSRRQVIHTKRLDLNESVRQVGQMLQRILPQTIELQIHSQAGELNVLADESMLDQVLMNLAVNARDAMPQGGTLLLKTSRRTLTSGELQSHTEVEPGPFAVLSVADTGSGIPPEIMPRIFEPFFTTKDVGKGTGLGLSTVHGIVKQHKGFIEVQSMVESGTTFRVYLPLASNSSLRSGPQSQPSSAITETLDLEVAGGVALPAELTAG
jgi:signal transduction histidine kinase